MSAVVGSHSRGVSAEALRNVFLGAYAAVIPEEQHTAVGPRDRRNDPRGAVEQHVAPTTGPFCAHDLLVFQVGADA